MRTLLNCKTQLRDLFLIALCVVFAAHVQYISQSFPLLLIPGEESASGSSEAGLPSDKNKSCCGYKSPVSAIQNVPGRQGQINGE